MPYYLFEHIKTGRVEEVFFGMNEEKVFNGKNGKQVGKWRRVYTKPQAAIDSKWDEYSAKDFAAKTGAKKGSYGDIIDKSAELSAKRAEKNGKDAIKEKKFRDYEKRVGKKSYNELKEKQNKTVII